MKYLKTFICLLFCLINNFIQAQERDKVKIPITKEEFYAIKVDNHTLISLIEENKNKGNLNAFYDENIVVSESPVPLKGKFFRYDVKGSSFYYKCNEINNKKNADLIGITIKGLSSVTIKDKVVPFGNKIFKFNNSLKKSKKGVLIYKVNNSPLKCKIIYTKGKIRKINISFLKRALK